MGADRKALVARRFSMASFKPIEGFMSMVIFAPIASCRFFQQRIANFGRGLPGEIESLRTTLQHLFI